MAELERVPKRFRDAHRAHFLLMCGRFVQRPVLDFRLPSLVDLAPPLAEIPPSYNLAPTQRVLVILDRGTGRQVSRLALGLLPAERQDALGVTNAMMKAYAKSVPRVRPVGPTDKCKVQLLGNMGLERPLT